MKITLPPLELEYGGYVLNDYLTVSVDEAQLIRRLFPSEVTRAGSPVLEFRSSPHLKI